MKLSVTTVTIPDLDVEKRCSLLASPRYDGVEWRIRETTAEAAGKPFRIGPELLGPYLAHCHAAGWRPVAQDRREDGTLDWEYIGCDLSDSLLDIPQFIDDMNYVGYERYLSIEDFRQIPHEEKLGGQISYLRSLIS